MTTQGQSRATIDKQRCIASALSIGLRIAESFAIKQRWKQFNFWHFDANAGCGWNALAKVPGSPLVFHAMADEFLARMQRQAFFCDLNEGALHELQNRLSHNRDHLRSSYLFHGDNEDALAVFAERIRSCETKPEHAIGCVIVDPNGYWYRDKDGVGAPTGAVAAFTGAFPKIDLVLNLNTRFYRLARTKPWGSNMPPPRDLLSSLSKRYWLVKRTSVGGDEFLLAVGRNKQTGDHRCLGMHKLESLEGQEIVSRVEGGRQGKLLDAPSLPDVCGVPDASDLPSSANSGPPPSELPL